MVFDNTKYDVRLHNYDYRITGYQKSELNSFIPRFGVGNSTESEFNLLRSKTIDGNDGGILQKLWKDNNAVYASENLYPIKNNGIPYLVNIETYGTAAGTAPIFLATAKTKDYIFMAYKHGSGAATQGITRLDTGGISTALTLPVNLSGDTNHIHDMCIWNNQLWICASNTLSTGGTGAGSMYYMDLANLNVVDITAGTGNFFRMAVFKNQLYGTNCGSIAGCQFYRYSGDTTTKNFVQLATTPMSTMSFYSKEFVFNNRVYIARNDGLYAWDGLNLVTIADYTQQVDEQNFRFPCVMQGYMYYWMPDGFYRFNGSLIEKLYDITEVGFPTDMCVGKNRLWISYANSAASGSSAYNKSVGFNYSSGTNFDGQIFVFNGKAMYCYNRSATQVKSGTPVNAREGEYDKIAWFNNRLRLLLYADPTNRYAYIITDESAITGSRVWRIVSSVFDADFPMIDKNLENVQFLFDGATPSDFSINVDYRTSGFDGATGWSTVGQVLTNSLQNMPVWNLLPAGLVFKKIQFRFSATSTYPVSYTFTKIILRYNLNPDFKWQWNMTMLCYNKTGDNKYAAPILADATEYAASSDDLRGNVYDARNSAIPVIFIDVDHIDLSTTCTNVVTTINVGDSSILRGTSGFVMIDNEIIRYDGKTYGTLTLLTRGQLGTTAVAHNAGAKIYPLYRVVVRTIQNERVIIQDNSDVDIYNSRSSEIAIVLQEI